MITLFGIDHRSAPLALRERISFIEEEIPRALQTLVARVDEVFLLSTCNRTEIYAVTDAPDPIDTLLTFVADSRRVEPAELETHSYAREGEDAVAHLLRVSAGLEAMVLGETQILGQVRDSYQAAQKAGTIGRVFGRVLPLALEAGKRAHAATSIGRGALSPSSMAVERARRALGELTGRGVLVIGAGDAGKATVRALVDAGVGQITVANRSLDRAALVASSFRGQALPLTDLGSALAAVDIVISSTRSADHVVTTEAVRQAMRGRPSRPLLLIDIAVPRDVEPGVADVPGVMLYNVDDLEALCATNLAERRREIGAVEQILAEYLADYREWERTEPVTPMIGALYQRAESIRRSEVERTLRRLPALSTEERDMIDVMTASIVRRLLHTPVAVLKSSQDGPHGDAMARVMRQLFELAPEELALSEGER